MHIRLNLTHGRWALLAAGVLALASLACLGSVAAPTATPLPPPTPVPPTAVPPTAVPPTAAPSTGGTTGGGAGTGSVEIINNSSVTICYVYISSSSSTEWGNDQLGSENVVAPGGSFTIHSIPPGSYDMRADDCSNNQIGDAEFGVEISAGETVTWTFTD